MSDQNGNDDISEDLYHESLFCECYVVSFGDLRDYLKESPGCSLLKLQEELEVGHGCGSCLRNIIDLNGLLNILNLQETRS